jgi:hypothetical protein
MVMPLGMMAYALYLRTRWCCRQSLNGINISKLTMVMPSGTVMPLALMEQRAVIGSGHDIDALEHDGHAFGL